MVQNQAGAEPVECSGFPISRPLPKRDTKADGKRDSRPSDRCVTMKHTHGKLGEGTRHQESRPRTTRSDAPMQTRQSPALRADRHPHRGPDDPACRPPRPDCHLGPKVGLIGTTRGGANMSWVPVRRPNDLLRRAREARVSPSGSGRPMSRQELADAASVYLPHPITAAYIGKLERGELRWPAKATRAALRHVLGANHDHDLGFYITRRLSRQVDDEPIGQADRREGLEHRKLLGGLGSAGDSVTAGLVLPSGFRARLIAGFEPVENPACPLPELIARVALAHGYYQEARYQRAAAAVTSVLSLVTAYVNSDSSSTRRRAHAAVALANVLASKLAAKAGDAELAWITADRACVAADVVGDPTLHAAAMYQVACALGRTAGRLQDAQVLVDRELARLTKERVSPRYWSVRGALELQGAVLAAKLGDAPLARAHLAAAAHLADQLGTDRNHLWTAFGDTNVRLHEVAVAIALQRPDQAIRVGEAINTERLPPRLIGRRAQVHVDLGRAWAMTARNDRQALLHLLEAERLGAEVIRFNHAARAAVTVLLRRQGRSCIPGLATLAQRAGVEAP